MLHGFTTLYNIAFVKTGMECFNHSYWLTEFHGINKIHFNKNNNNKIALDPLQLEKSPTLGSIETTDHEKRCLSEQSLKFNLGDKIFNELFPDIASVRMFPTI